ncbi:hypothetical protein [Piscinibacter sp.]|jgi:hypothetical protein|uniref:hypothetical protein n=1 Tax=Piscinibacter sp. TaxID=1903157 RepID=UPI0035596A42
MVKPGGSRPVALSQRQVDDLARGQHADISPRLHAARMQPPTPTATPAAVSAASGPVPLAAKDMQSIVRSGAAPVRVLQRIAAATPAAAPSAKAKGKVQAVSRQASGSAPTLLPTKGSDRG